VFFFFFFFFVSKCQGHTRWQLWYWTDAPRPLRDIAEKTGFRPSGAISKSFQHSPGQFVALTITSSTRFKAYNHEGGGNAVSMAEQSWETSFY
ncbi:hypothetical protein F5Y19DRAFT_425676, partial [Xylariaceae sp. FL1651]